MGTIKRKIRLSHKESEEESRVSDTREEAEVSFCSGREDPRTISDGKLMNGSSPHSSVAVSFDCAMEVAVSGIQENSPSRGRKKAGSSDQELADRRAVG